MRSQVSLDIPLKVLHIEFDLATMVPPNTTILDILFEVLGRELADANIKDLLPRLRNLLVGM